MKYITTYEVETLRSGQLRPYADHESEYLITVKSTQYGKEGLQPYVLYGNLEDWVPDDPASSERRRKEQQDWAKRLVHSLCQNFREHGDNDGRTGMDAHFYPTLRKLEIDPQAGTIRVLIIDPFTD